MCISFSKPLVDRVCEQLLRAVHAGTCMHCFYTALTASSGTFLVIAWHVIHAVKDLCKVGSLAVTLHTSSGQILYSGKYLHNVVTVSHR